MAHMGSRRHFGLAGIAVLVVGLSTIFAQLRFRPDSEREDMGRESAYEQWVAAEGVPIYRGQAISSLLEIKLAPWKRMGVAGAFVELDGTGGFVNAFVTEIPIDGKTRPQKHFFEENILVLSGEGETQFWLPGQSNKQTVHWRKGSVFSPPLNSWHQHFNKAGEPARLASVSDAPFVMDFFHSSDLLFNIETAVTERYAGEASYFDPETGKDYAPYKGRHSLTLVNFIRNVRSAILSSAGQGYGDVDRHYVLSKNRMGTHVESFPVGTYERGHRHGPGASIIFLSGTGYSLYWSKELGTHPLSEGKGDEVSKVVWKEGTIFVPADQWYHQHFNTGKEPARFIKLGAPFGPGGRNVVYKMMARIHTEGGTHMIRYAEEDPLIRQTFEADLRENGAPLRMPPVEELIALEKEAEESNGGMLQVPKAH